MSCAYYFHAPENCAKLNFYNPINAGLRNYPTHVDKNYGNDYVTVTPVTDKVVFFPSWLDHGTTVNKTTEPRVVFSANWKWRPK